MKTERVLVTGSEGYIGAVLVKILLNAGYKVTGTDTLLYSDKPITPSGRSGYEFIRADIRDTESFDLTPYGAIIHLSALSNDPTGELNPTLTEDINFKATIALAKKAKAQGVKRFLFSSSCSVYGIAENGVVNEESEINPLTAYAKSKIASEEELKKLIDADFSVGLLRNSTVYGYSPSFRNDLVVNNFTTCALATKKIKVMSDGSPWRPLIDVRDISTVFMEFLKIEAAKINGEVFNIGFDENNVQVRDILDIVKKAVVGCEVIYTGEHGKDTRSYKVSFKKFAALFPHVKQRWSIEKSVKDMIRELSKINYSESDFAGNKFSRLAQIKKKLDSGNLDTTLRWHY